MTYDNVNVLALIKGKERYVFLYDDYSHAETVRQIERYACNPKLSFTWKDATVLSLKVRSVAMKTFESAEEIPPLMKSNLEKTLELTEHYVIDSA